MARGENVKREENHLDIVLQANGYPDHIIRSAARPRKGREPEETPKFTICIPYVAGVGEDLRRVCRRYDIRTVFSPGNRGLLASIKFTPGPPEEKERVIVAGIKHCVGKKLI